MASNRAVNGEPMPLGIPKVPYKVPWRRYCGSDQVFPSPYDNDREWALLYDTQKEYDRQLKILLTQNKERTKRAVVQVRHEKMRKERKNAHDAFAAYCESCKAPRPPQLTSYEEPTSRPAETHQKGTLRDAEPGATGAPAADTSPNAIEDEDSSTLFLTGVDHCDESQQAAPGRAVSAASSVSSPPWPLTRNEDEEERHQQAAHYRRASQVNDKRIFAPSPQTVLPSCFPQRRDEFLEAPGYLHWSPRSVGPGTPRSIGSHMHRAGLLSARRPTREAQRPVFSHIQPPVVIEMDLEGPVDTTGAEGIAPLQASRLSQHSNSGGSHRIAAPRPPTALKQRQQDSSALGAKRPQSARR